MGTKNPRSFVRLKVAAKRPNNLITNTLKIKAMKMRFKMWNNDNGGFRVTDCFVNSMADLKAKVNELRASWTNIEAFLGENKVISVYQNL